MRLAGVLIGPALLAFALVSALQQFIPEPGSAQKTRPTGLAWADRVFTSREEFAAWLERRGHSYQTWLERHPDTDWAATGPRTVAPARKPTQAAPEPPEVGRDEGSAVLLVGGAAIVVLTGLLTMGIVLARNVPRRIAYVTVAGLSASGGAAATLGASARRLEAAAAETVAAARPRLAGAGVTAGQRLEAAATETVAAARPRLASAGANGRRLAEAAAAELELLGGSIRFAIANGRLRGPLFYAFATAFSAAVGVATAILI
jgi:hypothetical protein